MLSGRNPNFKYTISGVKPHILVLNKKDLIHRHHIPKIIDKIRHEEGIEHVIFSNCKDSRCDGIKKLLPLSSELIGNSERYNRSDENDFCLMIIGVPNVGKSSLINALRNRNLQKKNAAPVGAIAGITRSVLNRIKICDDPLVYLLDTPGILTPNIGSTEIGMKLALCACLQDHLVGPELIADYLLFWLNKHNKFVYTKKIGIDKPTDNIAEVLLEYSKLLNKTKKMKDFNGNIVVRPDLLSAAQNFIKLYRTGELGKILLDLDEIENNTIM